MHKLCTNFSPPLLSLRTPDVDVTFNRNGSGGVGSDINTSPSAPAPGSSLLDNDTSNGKTSGSSSGSGPGDQIVEGQGDDSAIHDLSSYTTYHPSPAPHLLSPVGVGAGAGAGGEVKLETILRELGFGYRAGFIASTLSTLRERFGSGEGDVERGLMALRGTGGGGGAGEQQNDVEQTREVLCSFKGVGRKVADCVMLMCLDQVSRTVSRVVNGTATHLRA